MLKWSFKESKVFISDPQLKKFAHHFSSISNWTSSLVSLTGTSSKPSSSRLAAEFAVKISDGIKLSV
jgi:hypothetical protein